jgi:hypothetical protein
MRKSQSKRNAFRLGKFISMVAVIVILIGAGVLLLPRIEWSPSSKQDAAVIGVPSAVPQETDTPDPTGLSIYRDCKRWENSAKKLCLCAV